MNITELLGVLVLLVSVVAIVLQVLLVRQVGILHARLGPEVPANTPNDTRLLGFTLANGQEYRLEDHIETRIVILSTSCTTCYPILRNIGVEAFPSLLIGLALHSAQSLQSACNKYAIDPSACFDANALADDLKVFQMPSLVVLTKKGVVSRRAVVSDLGSLRREVQLRLPEANGMKPIHHTDREKQNNALA